MNRSPVHPLLALAALLAAPACVPDSAADPAPGAARRVLVIEGFAGPESVRYDPDQDVYLVSNIAGAGSVKDGFGYISRVDAADPRRIDTLVRGGHGGATLHAPKGMALQGDTLWVADIDVLRGFHRRTGAPLAEVDMRPHGAVLLNDVALAPDGSLRVTDSGIVMSPEGVHFPGGDKILSVSGPDHRVAVVASGPGLLHPNGIAWDPAERRWVVAAFHPFRGEVYALRDGDTARTVLARGAGRFDGVEVLPDGRVLYTSWTDSSLHLVSGGRDVRVARDLWQPADLGVDTRRGRVAVPLVLQGRVELWTVPER